LILKLNSKDENRYLKINKAEALKIKLKRINMNIIEGIIKWNEERGLDKQPFNLDKENISCLEEIFETYEYNDHFYDGFGISKDAKNPEREAATKVIDTLKNEAIKGPQNEEEIIDSLADRVVFSVGAMLKLGYDPQKVMEEVLKEINSRVGHFDEKEGKFIKDTSPEAKANWYKANYKIAKR